MHMTTKGFKRGNNHLAPRGFSCLSVSISVNWTACPPPLVLNTSPWWRAKDFNSTETKKRLSKTTRKGKLPWLAWSQSPHPRPLPGESKRTCHTWRELSRWEHLLWWHWGCLAGELYPGPHYWWVYDQPTSRHLRSASVCVEAEQAAQSIQLKHKHSKTNRSQATSMLKC